MPMALCGTPCSGGPAQIRCSFAINPSSSALVPRAWDRSCRVYNSIICRNVVRWSRMTSSFCGQTRSASSPAPTFSAACCKALRDQHCHRRSMDGRVTGTVAKVGSGRSGGAWQRVFTRGRHRFLPNTIVALHRRRLAITRGTAADYGIARGGSRALRLRQGHLPREPCRWPASALQWLRRTVQLQHRRQRVCRL